MNNFFLRPRVRAFITGILTLAVSISLAILGNWNLKQNFFWIKLTIFFIFSILHIIYLIFCTAQQVKDSILMSEYKKQLTAYETALTGIIHISQSNASNLNICIHSFETKKAIPQNVWEYKKVCYEICKIIYDFVYKLSDNQECEVAYVRLNEKVDGEISMFAYANHNNQTPKLLNQKRNFKNKTFSQVQYYDMSLFEEDVNETKVLYGSDIINKKFYRTSDEREKKPNKYNQFIGIPVFCDNKKMVGLLEIACLEKCSLGKSEDELRDIANRYFVPYSNLFLLLHKMEKALYLGM